ncbi:MAG: NAD(P)H-binding protein, partial [Bacteroidota bacterium]
ARRMVMTILLAGASGLVGRHALDMLLGTPEYTRILIPTRRDLAGSDRLGLLVQHPNVRQVIVDFAKLEDYADDLRADHVLCALGTTIKQAGSQARFFEIDRDMPVALARVTKAAGATRFAYVSSLGADEDARTFYLRSKGETEALLRNVHVRGEGFESVTLLRPSLLLGDRGEFRFGERIGQGLGALVRPLLPARVKPVHAATVAAALIQAVRQNHVGARVAEGGALFELAEGWRREVRD